MCGYACVMCGKCGKPIPKDIAERQSKMPPNAPTLVAAPGEVMSIRDNVGVVLRSSSESRIDISAV